MLFVSVGAVFGVCTAIDNVGAGAGAGFSVSVGNHCCAVLYNSGMLF